MHALLAALLLMLAPVRVYGSALRVWECQDESVVFDGPAGTGKTFSDLCLADLVARKYPGSRQLFARDTRVSLSQTILVTYEGKVLGPDSPVCSGASRRTRESYVYPNGSEIVVGGLDNAERLRSGEYDRIYIFEATVGVSEDDYIELKRCLRNNRTAYHQIILECNPSHPAHWIKQLFERGGATRIKASHTDNPAMFDQIKREWTPLGKRYIEGTLSSMTGHLRRRLLDGEWAGADGLVYSNFSRDQNVTEIKRASWPETMIACDDGISNPFVALLIRVDEDDRVHVEREFYATNMLIRDKIEAVKKLRGDTGCEVLIDPAAAQLVAEMRNEGLEVMSADNKRDDGINRIHARLSPATDKRPRLTVDPSCTNTIREFESYMRKKHKDGHFIDEPEKVNDHSMDALRYAINRIDGRAKLSLIEPSYSRHDDDEWGGW